jgi:hypothetical protein
MYLLKIVPVIIIFALLIWEVTLYNYSLEPIDNMVGSRLYIKNIGDVSVDYIWKRNDKVIIVYTNELYNDQIGYAFFKEGIIPGKYKEYHNFTTDGDVINEAIQVDNVLISIVITRDEVVEKNFTITRDWTRSNIFRILVLFLLYSFITRSKNFRRFKNILSK